MAAVEVINVKTPVSLAKGHSKRDLVAAAARLPLALLLALSLLGAVPGCSGPFPPPEPGTPAPTAPPIVATAAPLTSPVVVGTAIVGVAGFPVVLQKPNGWVSRESATRLVLAADQAVLAGAELEGPALVVVQLEGASSAEAVIQSVDLKSAKVARQGATTIGGKEGQLVEATLISPASGRGYRTIFAAAVHGGKGYLFTASAPLEQWEKAGPLLQGMLNGVTWR